MSSIVPPPAAVDVAVVGCGPVGSLLANLLARRGVRVAVLERRPARYPLPRAVHVDDEAARILQAAGVAPFLDEHTEPADVYEWRNAAGDTLLRFGRVGARRNGWPLGSMFHQPSLEAALDQQLAALGNATLRRGITVDDLRDDGDGVRVTAVNRDGTTHDIDAAYVIGCDGANSTVRQLVGVEFVDLGYFHEWFVADVVIDEPRVFDPLNQQICDPARPTTMVSGGPGRRRWEFMRLPDEDPSVFEDERFVWELLAPWDLDPGNARLERHTSYTFQARHADRWRVGRVVLVGDAAHQMPPFAGQGMCSGVRDAANLAWKLAAVLDGAVDASILDAYQSERLPHVRGAIEFSMSLGEVICQHDPEQAAARDEAMAGQLDEGGSTEVPPLPGLGDGIVRFDHPLAGTLFPQGADESVDPPIRSDDRFGTRWLLYVAPGVDVPPSAADCLSQLDGAIVVADPDGPLTKAQAETMAEHDADAVLQRPDGYVYAAGDDPAGLCRDLRERWSIEALTLDGGTTSAST